jgi:CRP-like cAMP-binding protein
MSTADLARVPLFADLPSEELENLATCLHRRRYERGETIFREQDPGSSMFLIEAGKVKIGLVSPDGKEVVVGVFGQGCFFGELALLDGAPRTADAMAVEPSSVLMLGRNDFVRYLEAHPKVAINLLQVLTRRIRRDGQLIRDAAFDVPARLARLLLRLADGRPVPVDVGAFTQNDLANMIGATRESVNKWLGCFQREGLVRRNGRHLIVVGPAELQKRIG